MKRRDEEIQIVQRTTSTISNRNEDISWFSDEKNTNKNNLNLNFKVD